MVGNRRIAGQPLEERAEPSDTCSGQAAAGRGVHPLGDARILEGRADEFEGLARASKATAFRVVVSLTIGERASV